MRCPRFFVGPVSNFMVRVSGFVGYISEFMVCISEFVRSVSGLECMFLILWDISSILWGLSASPWDISAILRMCQRFWGRVSNFGDVSATRPYMRSWMHSVRRFSDTPIHAEILGGGHFFDEHHYIPHELEQLFALCHIVFVGTCR